MTSEKKHESGVVLSVLKALNALDFVAERALTSPGAGLSEIAAALGIRPSTARNILKTMERAGYIGRGGKCLYVPGAKCFGLSRAARSASRLVSAMSPRIAELAERFGESLVVSTLFNGMRKVLLRRQGSAEIVVETRNAERDSLAYRLVTTRIMLAFAARREVELFVEVNGLPGGEWAGIDSVAALDRALEALRMAGYAEMFTAPGDNGTYAAAFPILDSAGSMLGALGLYMPAFRLTPELKRALFDAIHRQLTELREKLR